MLINLTNHPSERWEAAQMKVACSIYGRVEDMNFPSVDPEGDQGYISRLAGQFAQECMQMLDAGTHERHAVHVMGELTFCFALVARLQRMGVECVASTSRREVLEGETGEKLSVFSFVAFRAYEPLRAMEQA